MSKLELKADSKLERDKSELEFRYFLIYFFFSSLSTLIIISGSVNNNWEFFSYLMSLVLKFPSTLDETDSAYFVT